MFSIIHVPPDASEEIESVGSKRKFWYTRRDIDDQRPWLYKAVRRIDEQTWAGEDWAEKVSAELCSLIGLPHAHYEFAEWMDTPGVVTRRIDRDDEDLVLGNVVLAGFVSGYPEITTEQFYRIPEYTLELVLDTLDHPDLGVAVDPSWELPVDVSTPAEAFVGFLLIDAWIGNTDRHDKNWAILDRRTEAGLERYLAPTFDHASSLGRELTDRERRERLTTRDRNRTVAAYVQRARSGFFRKEGDRKTMHPLTSFELAATRYPDAARAWLRSLHGVRDRRVDAILEACPDHRISPVGTQFAREVLHLNRETILELF